MERARRFGRTKPNGRSPFGSRSNHHFRGGRDAGLDAAMAFLDHGFADKFLRRRSFEVGFDFGFQGRLIAFQRQQEIGLCSTILAGIST